MIQPESLTVFTKTFCGIGIVQYKSAFTKKDVCEGDERDFGCIAQ